MEGSASRGRHAPIEWREEESDLLLLPTQPAAERMKGWREEKAGTMDRPADEREGGAPVYIGRLC